MINKENKNNVGIKKSIYMVKSNKLFKLPFKKNIKVLDLNQINPNKSLYDKFPKHISFRKHNEININNNPHIKNLISQFFNKLSKRKYKRDKLNQNNGKIDSLITRNRFKSDDLKKEYKILEKYNLNFENEALKNKLRDFNLSFSKNVNKFFIKSKTLEKYSNKKCDYKTILLKKNLSIYNNENSTLDLENIKVEKESIISSKNNKLFNYNFKKAQNKNKINSLCQTNLSIFDNNDEKENQKDISSQINKSVFQSKNLNKKKIYQLLNKKMNPKINQKHAIFKENNYNFKENTFLFNKNYFKKKINKTIFKNKNYITKENVFTPKVLSVDVNKNTNKLKLRRLININLINDKKIANFKNPVCLVNNYYLSF